MFLKNNFNVPLNIQIEVISKSVIKKKTRNNVEEFCPSRTSNGSNIQQLFKLCVGISVRFGLPIYIMKCKSSSLTRVNISSLALINSYLL